MTTRRREELLVRRNRHTREVAFYRCYPAAQVPLFTPVQAAGQMDVEETFQASKGPAGLDEHQVRRRTSWHRWVTLTFARPRVPRRSRGRRTQRPGPADLIG